LKCGLSPIGSPVPDEEDTDALLKVKLFLSPNRPAIPKSDKQPFTEFPFHSKIGIFIVAAFLAALQRYLCLKPLDAAALVIAPEGLKTGLNGEGNHNDGKNDGKSADRRGRTDRRS
jgi:hypothetical protein